MAQDGAQATGKGEAFFFIYGNLQHTGQLVFHRVFDGDDLVASGLGLGQGGVEGGSFTGTGGAGDQQHAVSRFHQLAHSGQGFGIKTQCTQAELAMRLDHGLFIEDTDHRIFTVDAWHDGDPQIDQTVLGTHLKAAVLWHAALGNVQFGQHF